MSDQISPSRWWYGITLEVFYAIGSIALYLIGQFYLTLEIVYLLGIVVGLGTFLMVIVFPISLYKDATAIQEVNINWTPNPALYALVGLAAHLSIIVIAQGATFLMLIPLTVSLLYLYKRHQAVGTP